MSKAQWGSENRTSSEQSVPSPPLIWQLKWVFLFPLIPHAGEVSREIANLTERKKSTYACIWCQKNWSILVSVRPGGGWVCGIVWVGKSSGMVKGNGSGLR